MLTYILLYFLNAACFIYTPNRANCQTFQKLQKAPEDQWAGWQRAEASGSSANTAVATPAGYFTLLDLYCLLTCPVQRCTRGLHGISNLMSWDSVPVFKKITDNQLEKSMYIYHIHTPHTLLQASHHQTAVRLMQTYYCRSTQSMITE